MVAVNTSQQSTVPSAAQGPSPAISDALPMLTPILKPKPSSVPSTLQQPSVPLVQPSPKIKPPPGSGSQSLRQSSLPLWEMFGSASNTPAVVAGMVTAGESLDLQVLAKAAVSKRKEQERQSTEAAARDSVIAELQRRAARQAAISAVAQQHALNWLQGPVDAEDADYVKHHVDLIQTLLAEANLLPPVTAENTDAAPAPNSIPAPTAAAPSSAVALAAFGEASIVAAAKAAAAEQAAGVATAATIADPVAAASAKAAAVDRAAAVLTAAVANASAAEATARSSAAVAALQAVAADGAAPAVAVAAAVDEAARALAAAKAKATATAEAALKAAVAQEEHRVVKKANAQLFLPLTVGLGGLVDYASDEDSHMSRALTDTKHPAQPSSGEAEVSAERHAIAAGKAAQRDLAAGLQSAQPGEASTLQPASWLPMYSMDPSSSHQQGSSGAAGGPAESEADATGGPPSADGPGLAGGQLPPSRLSGQQLGEVLDSLRELGSVHMNLSLLCGTGVLAFVDGLTHSLDAGVAFMASTMSRQWRSSLASHLYTVTQPWPLRNLAQEANQLVKQCAGKWGLALPPTPEAAQVAPTQAYTSGNKKKRKRDGWDSKKGGRGSAAALLRASGSAPEAQTLHQLSLARQAESGEARQLKRDLPALHTDPSTLTPTPPIPTPASSVASGLAAQQGIREAPAHEPQLRVADALVSSGQPAGAQAPASAVATAADTAGADPAAVGTAGDGAALTDSANADTSPAAAAAAAGGQDSIIDLAGSEVTAGFDHMEDIQSAAADASAPMPPAPEATQPDPHTSKASERFRAVDAAAVSEHSEDETPAPHELDTEARTARQAEARAEDHAEDKQGASDGTGAQTEDKQVAEGEHQDELQKAPHSQPKAAATGKPKGKRKATATSKGNAKRQKGKQDDREASPAPDKPATKAAASSPKAAAADEAAPAKAAAASAKAATTKGAATKPAVSNAAAPKQGLNKNKKAAPKASAADGRRAAVAGPNKKRKAATVAADTDDTDNDQPDQSAHDVHDDAVEAAEAVEAEAQEAADEAVAASAASTRDRRSKAKEGRAPPDPLPVKRATKQQKLPFTKAPAGSPKSGKATGTAAAGTSASAAASSGAAAGTSSKAGKGKAAADKKSGASSEPASSMKEVKGKQGKPSPKAAAAPSKQHSKTAKQQKPKAASGKGSKSAASEAAAAASEEVASEADESEAEEATEEAASEGRGKAKDTPVERAVAFLKQQQQQLTQSPYAQLKPLALAASKGTLQRLSKLPGWNRQSARKKNYASCDAALQAAVARHKSECADITKKRAKKEVLRLTSDLVTAVAELAN